MSTSHAKQPFFILFPSIVLPMFMAIIDQTIVTTALPQIAGSLGHVDRISWIIVAYLCATTIAAPIYGRLGDLLGRRRFLLVALSVFLVASVGCAMASNLTFLIAGRVLQGLGGGGLLTLSQALIGEAVKPADRVVYQGYLAFVAVCSSTLGPVLGGLLTEYFGWRSIFLINLPLGVAAVLLALKLPKRPGSATTFAFDWPGTATFVVLVTSLLLLLREVGRLDYEALPVILSLFVVAAVSAVLFAKLERRAPVPLLPLALFRDASIVRSNTLAACHGAVLVSLLTFVPIYLRVMLGMSPSEIGVLLLPMTIGVGCGSIMTSRLVKLSGRTAIFPSCGLMLATTTLIFVAWDIDGLEATQLSWILGLNSLLMGTVMQVVQLTVQSAASHDMLGSAAGSVQFSRSLGAAFGTAMVSALLFAVLRGGNADALHVFTSALTEGPEGIEEVAGTSLAGATLVTAFSAAFLLIAVFSALGSIAAWSLPIRRL